MSAKAASNVREKFSLEFVTADGEVAAFRKLLNAALPDLILFDPEAPVSSSVSAPEPVESSSYADPVEELRMLFGAVQ